MSKLQKQSQLRKLIPEMILLAAASSEPWEDIEVITLKQHAKDKVLDKASTMSYTSISELDDLVNNMYTKEPKSDNEFVKIESNKITVGLNCDIINDAMVDKAIIMLTELDSFEDGITYFKRSQ